VPIDSIIGGARMAGQGWRMLMDCLSAGRSISLPGLACGATQFACRAVSAYALVREQFGLPLTRFEGIEERLGRMAGKTWLMNAARRMTAGAVATGQKPSVISAIVKAYLTEAMREVVNDAMDVQGGAGIVRGPRNVLSRMYQAVPIGITVEGANILTRTLIIYGQGALRCHPHAFREMEAARMHDLRTFDRSFFSHVGFIATNLCRAAIHAWTRAALARSPMEGAPREHFQKFTRLSAAFAVVSDFAMGTLGGALKRKEMITGRLADALAWLYMGSACLKRFQEDGELEIDRPFLRYGCDLAAHNAEEALFGVLANLPNRAVARVLRVIAFPLGRSYAPPSDRTTVELSRALVENDETRDRLTADIHLPTDTEDRMGFLEKARAAIQVAEPVRRRLREAQKIHVLPRANELELLPLAVERGILSTVEAESVRQALALQDEAVQVDAHEARTYQELARR
jgi:acyl-CoA dehydrogenase